MPFKVENHNYGFQKLEIFMKSVVLVEALMVLPPLVCSEGFFTDHNEKMIKNHCKIVFFSQTLAISKLSSTKHISKLAAEY